jgi:invasion protein IalB
LNTNAWVDAVLRWMLVGRVALFGLCAPCAASAQSAPAAPVGAPAAQQPASQPAPAAERSWAVTCADASPQAARDCRITATAVLQPQGIRLLSAILSRQPETRSLALIFSVPHGAAVPAGLAWQIDESEPQRLAFQVSDGDGLYAGVPVSDDILAALRRGAALRVTYVVAARREPLAVALPLAQFSEAVGQFFAEERPRQ